MRWTKPKVASVPLLWLWFSKRQRRWTSDLARALGKRDVEASATRVLEKEEAGEVLGVPEKLERQMGPRAWLWT